MSPSLLVRDWLEVEVAVPAYHSITYSADLVWLGNQPVFEALALSVRLLWMETGSV